MSDTREEMIRSRLNETLSPRSLNIINESHKHAGHASAGGAGHFVVEIVADAFQDKPTLQRHRMVYDAVQDIMHSEIHALSINAKTPAEAGF
jgi:BolA protein